MDISKARVGQRDLFKVATERIRAGETWTTGVLPCGYGKSDEFRLVAYALWTEKIIPVTIVVSPTDYLRTQFVSPKNMNKFIERYEIRPPHGVKLGYSTITARRSAYASQGEFLLSTTPQLLIKSADHFNKWIEAVIERTGLRPLFGIDEVHNYGPKNDATIQSWAETIQGFANAGAFIFCQTATDYRGDEGSILGFDVVEGDSHDIKVYRARPDDKEMDVYGGIERKLKLKAHHKTGNRQAWDEDALCHISKVPVDVVVRGEKDAEDRMISTLSEYQARKALGKAVRDPRVIEEGCRHMVRVLRTIRHANYLNVAAIVFCGADKSNDELINQHAKDIRNAILRIDANLNVVIATSADEGTEGSEVLRAFADDGVGDVLIVKAMAGLGYDAPRLKVGLDLSPMRTPNAQMQRMNRITRPYQNLLVAYWVTLIDVLAQSNFKMLVEDEGGAASMRELEFLRSYPYEPETDPENNQYYVRGVGSGPVDDTKEQSIEDEDVIDGVFRLLEIFPEIGERLTMPDLGARLNGYDLKITPYAISDDILFDTGDVVKKRHRDATEIARNITNIRFARAGHRYIKGNKEIQDIYSQFRRNTWNEAKPACGFAGELELCEDIAALDRLIDTLKLIETREIDRR